MATMKMTGCMKLVARMPQADQDALLARLDQYQADGIPGERAQMMAATDMLEEIRAERTQIFDAIAEQFPELMQVAVQEAPAEVGGVGGAGATLSRQRNPQVDTPEFKRWFGDSQVVDENGKPLVMYHGTDAYTVGSFMGDRGVAGHFAFDPEFANQFAESKASDNRATAEADEDVYDGRETVYPVYLSAKNIFDARNPEHRAAVGMKYRSGDSFSYSDLENNIQRIKRAGFDSYYDFEYVSELTNESEPNGIAVFNPNQIKSATGNQGTFDPNNPDITLSRTRGWRDETNRLQFAPGAAAYSVIAGITNKVLDKIGLKPIDPKLGRAMRQMKVEVEKVQNLTVDVAEKLKTLTEDERKMISDVIEGELRAGVTPPKKVLDLAASMQQIMSEQSAELVRLGMLSPDAAARWENKYLPRFYEKRFKDEVQGWAKAALALVRKPKAMQGIRGNSLKSRGLFKTIAADELQSWQAQGWEIRDPGYKPGVDQDVQIWRDFTRDERDQMGEIRDSMFRFVMGYNSTQRDIALGRLYERLARDYASRNEKEGFVLVPSTDVKDTQAKRYGALAGMWVPKEIMDHLTAYDSYGQNELMKMYLSALAKWKEGKTVLNPVAHANNVISNLTMAHFAGVSYWDAGKYAGAIRDLMRDTPMVNEAKDAGLFLGTFNRADLLRDMPEQLKALAGASESKLAKGAESTWNALTFFLRKPLSKAYDAEDQFFRYLIYRDARGRGLDPQESVEYAQRFIFTYDDLPSTARKLRDFALPFFSYTYKAVPALASTAMTHPWRFAMPAGVLYGINAIAYALAAGADEGEDDWAEIIRRYISDSEFRKRARELEESERQNLPKWMKGHSAVLATPKAIRLGMDDLTNLPLFLDATRIIPSGDLLDAVNNSGGIAMLQPLTPNNPLLTIFGAMMLNKDGFLGKDIVSPTDTSAEAAAKRGEWLWRQLTPALAVGSYHWDRAMNAVASAVGEPVMGYTGIGKDGLPVQPKYAVMQTVGVKVRPIDLEMSELLDQAERKRMVRELDAEIRRINRLENRGAITPENAEEMRDRQREKRQNLREGLTVGGDERD